ncbi:MULTISPECIES: hypothetical protein [unclassified Pantoea]|uniref:hypothetical protein n=1 Tax=unclassified Pantoea TaxID=2630326 RepID=UPI0025808F4E|nr:MULTISPECIES: hypothetical protein [unclassified Pantoea]MDU5473982.1 hypothetical protein [Pantoea sp.]
MTIQRFNAVAAAAIVPAAKGKYTLAADYDALQQENDRLRAAIESAIAPGLWTLICAEEDAWRYNGGKEKYWDVLKRALGTDESAAELRAGASKVDEK